MAIESVQQSSTRRKHLLCELCEASERTDGDSLATSSCCVSTSRAQGIFAIRWIESTAVALAKLRRNHSSIVEQLSRAAHVRWRSTPNDWKGMLLSNNYGRRQNMRLLLRLIDRKLILALATAEDVADVLTRQSKSQAAGQHARSSRRMSTWPSTWRIRDS